MRIKALIAGCLLLSACTSHEVKPVDPFVFGKGVYRVENRGVVLGIEPYSDSGSIEDTFDVDMSKGGYYPLRLSITNLSERRLVVERADVRLVDAEGNVHQSLSAEELVADLRRNSVAYGILGFGVLSFNSAEQANADMRADWESKGLPASLFFGRGQKQEGFVYFRLPEGIMPESTTFELPVTDFASGERFSLITALSADR